MTQHSFNAYVSIDTAQPVRPGNTVISVLRFRNQLGYLMAMEDPVVTIRDPQGANVVTAAPMAFSQATRKASHHLQTTVGMLEGTYLVECSGTVTVFGPSGDQSVTLLASATFTLRRTVP